MTDTASEIERNVAAFLLGMGDAGGGRHRNDDEIEWTIGGSPIGYHNAVIRCRAADDDRARVLARESLAALQERALPGCWHVTPAMRPSSLSHILERTGFVDGGEEPAMAMELNDIASPASALDVEVVSSSPQLAAYRDVLADGFGEGPKEADWVAAAFERIGFDADRGWRHLVGRVDGEPIAAASVLRTGATAGIYFVATRPAFRQRGFGTAITQHALVAAKAMGASLAVLGSSPMGQHVYERLGFETLFTYRLFEWEPPLASSAS